MDAALKAKWIEALRSGDYQQGPGKLHDTNTNSYCCLGVLCKAIGAEFCQVEIETECDDGTYPVRVGCAPVLNGRPLVSDDAEELSAAFCKEIGLQDQADLITLNDGYSRPGEPGFKPRQPFSVIADYIEANL
jgi:hypothetical protein